MSTANITPTTIDGIKRLAKTISKRDGVPHAVGLDRASIRAGYSNYTNARRVLMSSTTSTRPNFKTFISVWWRDPKTKARGTEIVEVSLPKPLDEIVETRHFKNARGLWNFKRWAPDLIVCQTNPQSEDGAISAACTAARTLQFMAATGLKPSKSDALPGGGGTGRLPGRDHCSSWFDPATKKKVILDEPYAAAVSDRQLERDAWADRNNWQIVKSAWGGIYFPDGGSELYLLSDRKKGTALEPIEAVLSALGAPVVPENCRRVATTDAEPFRTPGEIQMEAEKAAKALIPKTARVAGKASTTVPYKMLFASGTRPKTKMPVEKHSEVGKLLKEVLTATRGRAGVTKRVDQVRSELDNWAQLEYDRKTLPDGEFFDLYYHERVEVPEAERGVVGRAHHVERLQSAKAILVSAYPDSKPLRDLIKKIDLAIKSLEAWR
ncbi:MULTISPECIES: DUF5623 domain-containing protein [Alphaproteobacteria]|uniref:DUF5623 domain-containing protein n=2 Tax=Alphaproteobacteria TaxID=28211 RepID=A0A512HLG3_9HYPH|nr:MULTISPECIES: DUF5623 domain-containing protein [Alphaproteobacteria]GEO86284.1 hypothetical protein RNA01_32160 [Ciceribacter naphthalenivorans]GLR21766.1 hypothetical protein GCM10007920_15530 [Ciceribacter naphthalenivorans]GLT04622.1 hypothetical protein GCM10007926_15530 [Sphingomonas psychrolutea]